MINKTEQIAVAAEIYARCNVSTRLVLAKPMRGFWHMIDIPLTADNVALAISTVEETEKEGLKFRFRPSNSVFYRLASINSVDVVPLASVETVDALMVSIAAETGCRVNRGHAIEKLVSEYYGARWELNPIQAGFWQCPDVMAQTAHESWIQVKAYGGSVTEKDLRAAIRAQKQ